VLRALLPDAQLDVRLTQSGLQLLDLFDKTPLARVDARLATLDKPGLAALQELTLPSRNRLLARLASTSSLTGRHLTRDDRQDKPELVFKSKNWGTCHEQLPSQEPDNNPTARIREAGQEAPRALKLCNLVQTRNQVAGASPARLHA
jgi:hypothetical protein